MAFAAPLRGVSLRLEARSTEDADAVGFQLPADVGEERRLLLGGYVFDHVQSKSGVVRILRLRLGEIDDGESAEWIGLFPDARFLDEYRIKVDAVDATSILCQQARAEP